MSCLKPSASSTSGSSPAVNRDGQRSRAAKLQDLPARAPRRSRRYPGNTEQGKSERARSEQGDTRQGGTGRGKSGQDAPAPPGARIQPNTCSSSNRILGRDHHATCSAAGDGRNRGAFQSPFKRHRRLLAATAVRYPNHIILCYDEFMAYVGSAIPPPEPFVLLAESFSTPLAIRCGASNPRNLRALVICAGFVCSPVTGLGRFAATHLAPLLVRFGRSNFPSSFLSGFWRESLLVGPRASPSLLNEPRSAISSVRLEV